MKRIYKIRTKMTSQVCEIKGKYNDFFTPDDLKSIAQANIPYGCSDKYIFIANIKNKIIGIEQIHNSIDAITTAIKANAASIVIVMALPHHVRLKENYNSIKDIPGFSFHHAIKEMCELFDIAWLETIVLDSNSNCIAYNEV